MLDRVLFFNFTTETGLVQFVLFIAVLVLVAVVSRRDTASAGESFQFAAATIPARLRDIWWVKRMPHFIAGLALITAVVIPFLSDKSERHQTWATVIAFALCAVSVVVLTAGRAAVARADGVRRSGRTDRGCTDPRLQANIGWRDWRIIDGLIGGTSFPWAMLLGASFASIVAVIVGIGALRVRGLLLAISTLAFAIAARRCTSSTGRSSPPTSTVRIPCVDIGLEITHKNRALLLLRADHPGGGAPARRSPPAYRHRANDHRRARERAGGVGDDGVTCAAPSSPHSRWAGSSPGSVACCSGR